MVMISFILLIRINVECDMMIVFNVSMKMMRKMRVLVVKIN